MFSNSNRALLALVALVMAIFSVLFGMGLQSPHRERWFLRAAFCLVACFILIFGYFRYSAVGPAFVASARGEFGKARSLIKQVKRPDRLTPESRAYYELTLGSLAIRESRLDEAERHLEAARGGALRTENDRGYAEFLLAKTMRLRGNHDMALSLLEQARATGHPI